jgi:protein required for attachment to host cells
MARNVCTWVVVADGSHARILENAGTGEGLEEISTEAVPDPPTHEIVSDRQGRHADSHGAGRHAMDPKTDPHRHAEREFARHLCALLDRAAQENRFERLIITAAPAMLGDIRALMSPHLRERVLAEVDKDYVHLSVRDLAERLSDVARF